MPDGNALALVQVALEALERPMCVGQREIGGVRERDFADSPHDIRPVDGCAAPAGAPHSLQEIVQRVGLGDGIAG